VVPFYAIILKYSSNQVRLVKSGSPQRAGGMLQFDSPSSCVETQLGLGW